MSEPRMIFNGSIVDMSKLRDRADRFDMVATSLSRNYRWGGLQVGTITVAAHSYLVYKETLKTYPSSLYDDGLLGYNALLHEIEEAFGVGDIVSEVKHAIFPDRTHYNEYKYMLAEQYGLRLLKDQRIKNMDVLVGMAEALCFLQNPNDLFDLYHLDEVAKKFAHEHHREIEELSAHIIVNNHIYTSPSVSRWLMLDALKDLNWGDLKNETIR
jgi:hypothetical protein